MKLQHLLLASLSATQSCWAAPQRDQPGIATPRQIESDAEIYVPNRHRALVFLEADDGKLFIVDAGTKPENGNVGEWVTTEFRDFDPTSIRQASIVEIGENRDVTVNCQIFVWGGKSRSPNVIKGKVQSGGDNKHESFTRTKDKRQIMTYSPSARLNGLQCRET